MWNRTPARCLPEDNGPALRLDSVVVLRLDGGLQTAGQRDSVCQQSGALSQPPGDVSLLHPACLQAREGQSLFCVTVCCWAEVA